MIIGGTKIQGKSLSVNLSLSLPADDLSGDTSSTSFSEQGKKGKGLQVSLIIPYANENWLKTLIKLAEKEEDGKRPTYDITDRVCNVLSVKQVRFSGMINIAKAGTLRAWQVSFNLTEVLSTNEKKDQRRRGSNTSASGFEAVIEQAKTIESA